MTPTATTTTASHATAGIAHRSTVTSLVAGPAAGSARGARRSRIVRDIARAAAAAA
jgi:hypothetical protein